jgi:hypothetical protein
MMGAHLLHKTAVENIDVVIRFRAIECFINKCRLASGSNWCENSISVVLYHLPKALDGAVEYGVLLLLGGPRYLR